MAESITPEWEDAVTQSAVRSMGVGEILDSAFSLYRSRFTVLAGTMLIGYLPGTLAGMGTGGLAYGEMPAGGSLGVSHMVFFILYMILSTVGTTVALGAVTWQLYGERSGEEISIADGLRAGLKRFWPLLGSMIIASLLMLLAFFGSGMAMAAIGGISGRILAVVMPNSEMALGIVMVVIGLATMIGMMVFFAYMLTRFFGVVPAVMIEGLSAWGSITRSNELAKGGRLRIMAVMGISWLIMMLAFIAIFMVIGFTSIPMSPEEVGQVSPLQSALYGVLTTVAMAVSMPCMAAIMVELYYDRRVRLEGYDLEAAVDSITVTG